MLDIASISAVVAAVGVIVGVILAILELRNITKTRQMELIMAIYTLFWDWRIHRCMGEDQD